MISAPNHQPLLNGNRKAFLLFLPLLLFSCGAFKKTVPPVEPSFPLADSVAVEHPNPDPPMDHPDPDPIPTENTAYSNVYFRGYSFKVPEHKSEFKIAIILPFHAGSKTPQQQMRADYMLEYYQGVQTAINAIEDLNSKYEVTIYDSRNDTNVLKQILRKSELKKMDLIIGPTDQEQVRIAAYFARENKIPLFSPVTIIDKMWSENSYFFNLCPSNEMKAAEFVAYIKSNHPKKKIIVVRDGQRFDKGFGSALISELEKQSTISYQAVNFSKDQKWKNLISKDAQYIVVHTCETKSDVNSSVTALMAVKDNVTVFSSDKWLEFTSVDYSFWQQLNLHFLSSDLSELGNAQSNEMRKRYRTLFNGDPSSFAYAGYDQMLFASELLNAFGEFFPLFIENKSFEYSNNTFALTKYNNCYQNRFLQIISFQDSKLSAINKF